MPLFRHCPRLPPSCRSSQCGTVDALDSPEYLCDLLRSHEHAGFPVVRPSGDQKLVYVGFLERGHLEASLRKHDNGWQLRYEDLNLQLLADPLLCAVQEAAEDCPLRRTPSPAAARGASSGPDEGGPAEGPST